MIQKTFSCMPKRPHPVFEDVIDQVADRIASEMDEDDCLYVSENLARQDIAQCLTVANAVKTTLHDRASMSVRYIHSIDHGPVGHYEITEYFIRIIKEELNKKKLNWLSRG